MSESSPMPDLIARVRTGDAQAATEFVRHYEPVIRSRIRVWLRMRDARLRRLFDSMDICQSVLASFFVRAAAGQFELERPESVVNLLVQMARHKLANQVQKQQAQRRDIRRVHSEGVHGMEVAGHDPTPSEWCAGQELLEELRKRLSDEEKLIADRRVDGHDWAAISAEIGGTPDGRRMQLTRALDRITSQLGIERGTR